MSGLVGQVGSRSGVVGSTTDSTQLDYEEGQFTPVLNLSAGTRTEGTKSGHYVKIGRMVHVSLFIQITNASSDAYISSITGFPFTAKGVSATSMRKMRDIGVTRNVYQLRASKNTTEFLIRRYDNAGTVATNYEFQGSITYLAN